MLYTSKIDNITIIEILDSVKLKIFEALEIEDNIYYELY